MLKHSMIPFVLLTAVLVYPAAAPASAGTVSLAWDPVDVGDLAGYRVYYDTEPGAFGDSIDVDTATAVTLSGLADCTTHYVAVKAYDTEANESSEFSTIVSGWARPSVVSVSPALVQRNSQAQLTIDGANFQSGAALLFPDPAISVDSVTVNGCTQIVASVTVGAAASLGNAVMDVVNPDQVFGSTSDLFGVTADAAGPVISFVTPSGVGATGATVGWVTDEAADSQVFFRLQGQSSYQATPLDSERVTDHQIALQGLAPESTYEFYVRSADASGNVTTSDPVQTLTTTSSSYDYIRIEAESASPEAPMRIATGAGAFRAAWLEVPAGQPTGTLGDPAGTAEFGFHVPQAGDYTVWFRLYGPSPQADSMYESVDGVEFGDLWATEWGVWTWVAGRTYTLDAGLHTATLGGREAEARVDRLLVTDDPDFVPTEQPGDDVTAPDPVSALSVTAGEGATTLSWTHPSDGGPLTLVVRYRTDGSFPASPADGLPLIEAGVTPGSTGGYEHTQLTNGATYSYSVFVIDTAGNASDPASAEATPAVSPPPPVHGLVRTDTY